MTADIAFSLLLLGFGLSVLQIYPSSNKSRLLASATCLSLTGAMGLLIYAYIVSDFAIVNVFLNSHTGKPLLYKITGSWGNHEGSMLLLNLIVCIYLTTYSWFGKEQPYKQHTLSIGFAIQAGLLAFLAFTSNPFETIGQIPPNGEGLNPLLQDIGLAIHPPILYVGYAGLALIFAATCAAITRQNVGEEWAKTIRYTLYISWSSLTLGIALGSWWAYRELGWGGMWFWDPVENASLLPWLTSTALLHSLSVVKHRQQLLRWSALLALSCFIMCLIAIFLVRSGILTSVHSFAVDPERGLFFIGFVGLTTIISLWLFTKIPSATKTLSLQSKEGFLLLNNILFLCLCATVLLGIIYPITLDLLGLAKVSVGNIYYHKIFHPIALGVLTLACFVPMFNWKKEKQPWQKLLHWTCLPSIAASLITYITSQHIVGSFAVGISLWLGLSSFRLLASYTKMTYAPFSISQTIPHKIWRVALGHVGIALVIAGITISNIYEKQSEAMLGAGETLNAGPIQITLRDMNISLGKNYVTRVGTFVLSDYKNQTITTLHPEVRYYPATKQNTTEASIHYGIFSNSYVVMGDTNGKDKFGVRLYYKPFIHLTWLGTWFIVLAGILGLRRPS